MQEDTEIIYLDQAERHDVINFLIQEHNMETPNYLEIGVQRGLTFVKVNTDKKTAVDPYPTDEGVAVTNFKMTSDDFFAQIDINTAYDVIFIDGLHECHQVAKDFVNSLKHSKEGTLIVFDDVFPHNEQEQIIPVSSVKGPSTGDVWKLIYHLIPIFKTIELDMYFFEKLHFQIRGMFAIKVNKALLDMKEEPLLNELDGNFISNTYTYASHFENYSSMLR